MTLEVDTPASLRSSQVDLAKLRQLIVDNFSDNELRDLCFDLQVDYDSLEAIGKAGKSRELVGLAARQRRVQALVDLCQELRPQTDWTIVAWVVGDELPPFKGLQPFDEVDADLFYGREELTADLITRLHTTIQHKGGAFLAVVGASGSGKSSVVRAGLIPVLRRGIPLPDGTRLTGDHAHWPIHILTPTAHPLESLATSLTQDEDLTATTNLLANLGRDPRALHLTVRKLLSPSLSRADTKGDTGSGGQGARLLLFIDQFEEIFTLCRDEAERVAFINNLITAATAENSRTIVLLTLRADFYAQCSQYDNLREQLEQNQKFLGPMTAKELRRAIEEPARRSDYSFETGLIDSILREVGSEPGALPLLSHALLETWKRRRERTLTFEGYNEAGGIYGAIAKTADTVYSYQLSPEQQPIARHIFLSLTEIGHGTQDTRRRAALEELIRKPEDEPVIQAVLRILTDARLVIIGEKTAEVAHEALIREWPTLRNWLDENREGLRLHRQLAEDASEWAQLAYDAGTLYRGAKLAHTLEWAEQHPDELTELEAKFLYTSRDVVEQEQAEREAQRQRELETAQRLAESERQRAEEQAKTAVTLKRRAIYLAGVGVVAVILAVAAAFLGLRAIRQSGQLAVANREAEQKTRTAEAGELAAQSQAIFADSPQLSLLLAVQAIRTLQPGDPRVPAAEEAMWHGLVAFGGESYYDHLGPVTDVAVSANGRWLASAGEDQRVILYDLLANPEKLTIAFTLPDSAGPIFTLAFSPDSRWLVTGSWEGEVRLWDMTQPDPAGQFQALTEGSSTTLSAVFSPDNRYLVTGRDDGTALLWDMDHLAEPIYSFGGHAGAVTAVAFSPDGETLITGSDDATLLVWDMSGFDSETAVSAVQLASYTGAVYAIAFSPDGTLLVTAGGTPPWINPSGGDYLVGLWQTTDLGSPPTLFAGHSGYITDVAISPDGQKLVTASWDKTIRVWELQNLNEPPLVLQGHEGYITSVAILPDNIHIVTGSGDNSIRLWDFQHLSQASALLNSHAAAVNALAITSNRLWLATGSDEGHIHLWQLADLNQSPLILSGHDGPITALATSENSNFLASSSTDGTVRLWDSSAVQVASSFLVLAGHEAGITSLAMSENGRWLASSSFDQTARLWDLNNPTGRPIILRGHEGTVVTTVISPDNQWLATGGEDGTVRLWDLSNPGVEQRILTGHAAGITSLTITADSHWLISGSWDGNALVWDLTNPVAAPVVWRGHEDGIVAVTSSPDGRWAVTASLDNTARLWDLTNPVASPLILRGHETWVTTLTVSKDGRWLMTGSQDGTVRLWDLNRPEVGSVVLQGHHKSINDLVVSPGNNFFVTASSDHTSRLWTLALDELLDLACLTAGRDFTQAEWEQYLPGQEYQAVCGGD